MNQRLLLALPLCLAAALVLTPALRGRPARVQAEVLEPGVPVAVTHVLGDLPPIYRIDVPDYATSLRIWTEDATADVAMLVSFEDFPDAELNSAALYGADDWVDEELWIHVTDYYSLEEGAWYVTCPVNTTVDWRAVGDTITYTLQCELFAPERRPLALDEPQTVTVRREEGLMAAFDCDATPPLARAGTTLRLEVYSDSADVDVVAGPQAAGETYHGAFAQGDSLLGYERVTFSAAESGRRFSVLAYALPELDPLRSVELTVLLTRDEPDSPTLAPAPIVPRGVAQEPLARALAATVGVFGPNGAGSGVVVSAAGHVLTNAHVVTGLPDPDGVVAPICVAFDRDRASAAGPTFGARLLEYREDLDLALLEIDSDLIRRPLPAGLRFPYLAPREDPEALTIGDPLWCVGYPMTGGSNSFVTVTATRGILSGFSEELEGLQYKVDADIHSGMSGGACIDSAGRLLGLPSASLSDYNEAGGLGFVTPLGNVPSDWWDHLRD